MSKYINADELIEALDDQIENEDSETDYKKGVQHGFWIIRNTIEETPSTDVVEVKHGEWIDKGSLSCRCSNCGCKSTKESKFCPNCGADMRGEIK